MTTGFEKVAQRFLSIKKVGAASTALFLVPAVVFAATPRTFAELVYFFVNLINLVVPILTGIAVIIFFWGIFR